VALGSANGSAGPDTVSFNPGVTGEIRLLSPLAITDDVTVNGPGAGVLSISGDSNNNDLPDFATSNVALGDTRIFEISDPSLPGQPTQKVTISGLTLKEGVSDSFSGTLQAEPGGAIYSSGTELHLNDDTLTGNRSTEEGGAVYLTAGTSGNDAGRLIVANSTFTGNKARGNGGAIFSGPNKYDPGEHIAGTVITDSQITGNTAGSNGTGFGSLADYSGDGGGLSLKYQLDISGTTVANNTVIDSGSGDGSGGGVYAPVSAGEIATTVIRGNSTPGSGGGIAMGGVKLSRSTVSGNTATSAGGVFALPATKYAGGSGTTRIDNSTVSGNTASNTPGDPYDGIGGGVAVYGFGDDSLVLRDSTVAGNTGSTGAGIFAITQGYDDEAVVRLKGSIVADNAGSADLFGGGVPPTMSGFPPQAGLFAAGFSLVESPGSAGLVGDPSGSNLTGVDPKLGPLAANGGPTQTMALDPTSPAIDAGQAFGFTTDQRGQGRPVDSAASNAPLSDGADIGAYELQDENAPGDDDVTRPTAKITKAPKTLKLKPGKAKAKAKVKFKGTDDRTAANALTFECKLDKGKFSKCSSPLKLKLDKGRHKVQVRATDAAGNTGRAKAKIKVVEKRKKR
jgi:hypothetical protein